MTHRSRRGFTLLELMVYIALLALFLNVSFDVFFSYEKSSKELRQNAADLVQVLRAGERWRSDVRASVEPPRLSETAQGWSFEIPQKNGAVVYEFADGILRRKADQKWTRVLAGLKSSAIHQDVRQRVTSWRWELELKSKPKRGAVQPLFTFESVASIQK